MKSSTKVDSEVEECICLCFLCGDASTINNNDPHAMMMDSTF